MTGCPTVNFTIIMYDAIRGCETWAYIGLRLIAANRFWLIILEGYFATWSIWRVARPV